MKKGLILFIFGIFIFISIGGVVFYMYTNNKNQRAGYKYYKFSYIKIDKVEETWEGKFLDSVDIWKITVSS